MEKNRRRLGVVVLSSIVLLGGGGVGWASWISGGTGTARAGATTATALVVTPGTPVGTLYPKPAGGYPSPAVGAIYTTVTNPNPYPVRVTTVSVGAVSITPLAGRTCAAGSVVPAATGPVALATPIDLAADSAATPVTIPGAIEMAATAEDGCQGASFSAPVTLTAVTT